MCGTDVAVWIPVKPRSLRRNENGEGFRLLILAARSPRRIPVRPSGSPFPRVNPTPATQEALIAYFGSHLSWPPLPAPHVRQQSEVEDIARRHGLRRDQPVENWARNRHDVLAGPDGLFKTADWYPNLGGKGRTLANHLGAFHRLVELGTIKLLPGPAVGERARREAVRDHRRATGAQCLNLGLSVDFKVRA